MHGGDIYFSDIKYDFSVNINPFYSTRRLFRSIFLWIEAIRQYPDIESTELIKTISVKYGIEEKKIIAGNGASELILAVVRALSPQKAFLLSPCFSGYEYALNSIGSEIKYINLEKKDDFWLTKEKSIQVIGMIEKEKPEMLFLCNPNNPNGKLCSPDILNDVIKACRDMGTFVLLDECFIELTGREEKFSFAKKIEGYDNLIVLNALTKTYAVPGLRLGFCFSSSDDIVSKIKKQLPEWNVSTLAQKTGTAILKEKNGISSSINKIKAEKKFLVSHLTDLGFEVFSSDSNFILFYSKKDFCLKEKLMKNKILIRDCSDYKGLEKGYYRIAVKSHGENKKLLSSLKKVQGGNVNEKY